MIESREQRLRTAREDAKNKVERARRAYELAVTALQALTRGRYTLKEWRAAMARCHESYEILNRACTRLQEAQEELEVEVEHHVKTI